MIISSGSEFIERSKRADRLPVIDSILDPKEEGGNHVHNRPFDTAEPHLTLLLSNIARLTDGHLTIHTSNSNAF